MDLIDEFFDFQQTCLSPSTGATDLEGNNSIISSTESTESIIQALCPSEDTIRNYLSLDQNNNSNDNNKPSTDSSLTTNLDTYRFHRGNNHQIEPMQLEFGHMNSQRLLSTSICPDQSSDNYHINLALDFIDYGNSVELHGFHHDYQLLQGLEISPQFTYNDYINLKADNLLLARLGFRFTMTFNTDNDKVEEIWDPNVANKILSAFYSPLGLKGNYLSNQVLLDQFESYMLNELVRAFTDRTTELADFSFKIRMIPSPAQFVYTCGKIKSFKKLCNIDKSVLLSKTFYNFVSWKSVIFYDRSIDGWIDLESGIKYERRDCFFWSREFHDLVVLAIEKLPDTWRNNLTIDVLISLIIIFNPDQPGLKYDEIVRQEQYLYIYLLQRYLESVCKSPCEVSENLYRLMVGAERCKESGKILGKKFDQLEIGYTGLLQNWIIGRINK